MPTCLEEALDHAVEAAESVEGLIRTDEVRLLFLAAALPTAEGEVVEIGSFKGKSTVALAKGALWAGQHTVVACDPFTGPSSTDPEVDGSTHEEFAAALRRHGVAENVEVHRTLSGEMAKDWSRPIRLLWIDGDHRYEGVKADVHGFFPHLATGAVVAFHDVGRSRFPGVTGCFIDDVLLSDAFGMCGLCHCIGWAQFVGSGGIRKHRQAKSTVYRLLTARLARHVLGEKLGPIARWRYRRLRKGRGFERWIASAHRERAVAASQQQGVPT